ncbi:MAG: OadG family protein [Peptoniphilaceae bacterium]
MWEGSTMTLFEAFQVSLTGFSIVFLTLICLALFIKITSAIVNSTTTKTSQSNTNENKVKTAPKKVEKEDQKDAALIAAIVAAVSAEMKKPVDKFRIVSIDEKK